MGTVTRRDISPSYIQSLVKERKGETIRKEGWKEDIFFLNLLITEQMIKMNTSINKQRISHFNFFFFDLRMP